jgi:hypothetical protein
LPELKAPPIAGADLKQEIAEEVQSCSVYAAALYDHGALVIQAVDCLFEQSPNDVTVAEVAEASSRLGADLQAHVDASEENGPRCLKSLEWCSGALQHDNQARVEQLSSAKVLPEQLSSAKAEPILSPEQAFHCMQLRSALMAHHSMVGEGIIPRLTVVQQVFVGAVKAENESNAAKGEPTK